MTTPLPQTPGDDREDHAEAVAAVLGVIFAAIEASLLASLASLVRRVAMGALLPALARRRLAQTVHAAYARAQPQIRAALQHAASETSAGVEEAVARDAGREAAMGMPVPDLSALGASIERASQTAAASLGEGLDAALMRATESAARAAEAGGRPPEPPNIFAAFRGPDDAYRRAVAEAITSTRGGLPATSLSLSRIQAAQKALDGLASQGITGFVDRAGRKWDLASYVEMATRTAVSSLWDDLQNTAMLRAGHDLALVYTHSTEGSCPRCLPWLGKVISIAPVSDEYPTLDEAKAEGFRHPSCRCAWHPIGAGIMAEVTSPVPMDEAAQVYKASQRQRALERKVRMAGRRSQVAVTPAARSAARRSLAAARAASEAHRRAHGIVQTKVGTRRREHPSHAH